MKIKLLKKLRKLAKKAVTLKAKVECTNVTYQIYLNILDDEKGYIKFSTLLRQYDGKDKIKAIDYLKDERRGYILEQLDNIREDMLNKELSKI